MQRKRTAMTLVQLGERVAMQLVSFADAARKREMEPASFHVGSRQFRALVAWAKEQTGTSMIFDMALTGIPVWRDERDYHLEIELINGQGLDRLEACLRL
jgi:hypothetical protein